MALWVGCPEGPGLWHLLHFGGWRWGLVSFQVIFPEEVTWLKSPKQGRMHIGSQAKIICFPLHGHKNGSTARLFPELITKEKKKMLCPECGPGQLCTKYSFFTWYLKFGRWPYYTGEIRIKPWPWSVKILSICMWDAFFLSIVYNPWLCNTKRVCPNDCFFVRNS